MGEENRVQQHIKYRHAVARLQLEHVQLKLQQICRHIKEKNPALIAHICKEVQK